MLDVNISVAVAAFNGSPIDKTLLYPKEEGALHAVLELAPCRNGGVEPVTSRHQRQLIDVAKDLILQSWHFAVVAPVNSAVKGCDRRSVEIVDGELHLDTGDKPFDMENQIERLACLDEWQVLSVVVSDLDFSEPDSADASSLFVADPLLSLHFQ